MVEDDLPAGHLANIVAAGAYAPAIGQGGRATVGKALDVVVMTDGRVAEGISTGLVAQADQLGEPSVEPPPGGIAADDHPLGLRWLGRVKRRRHQRRP